MSSRIKSQEARLKVFSEDRKSFLKLCKLFGLTDCDLVFDSASLNEAPVDLDDLVASHFETIQRNQRIHQLLVDILAEILGAEHPQLIDEIVGKGDMMKVRSRLNDIRADPVGTKEASSFESIEVQTDFPAKHQSIQTDAVEDTMAELSTDVIDTLQTHVNALQSEVDELRFSLDQKNIHISALNDEIKLLQEKSSQIGMLEDVAIRQAARDAEVAILRDELASLRNTQSECSDYDASIFRKNIFIKVLTYSLSGEYGNLAHMVPIIRTVFELDDDEATELSKLCESLNNQTVLSSILPNWR